MPQSDMETSSGLIMRVIRTLTNSKDDAEREAIKKRLEEALADSDTKLTKLVSDNHKELRMVMQTFTTVSKNLQTSLTVLFRAKKRLSDSRDMLTSKLDEVRRLSEESQKNDKILALLDEIDSLFSVPTKLNELVANDKYLEATELLTSKQKYIEDNLDTYESLRELFIELDDKRKELCRVFEEKRVTLDDGKLKEQIIEALKLIDESPETPDLELVKEKPDTVQTKPSLFKLSLSSHAICFNEHYKEQLGSKIY